MKDSERCTCEEARALLKESIGWRVKRKRDGAHWYEMKPELGERIRLFLNQERSGDEDEMEASTKNMEDQITTSRQVAEVEKAEDQSVAEPRRRVSSGCGCVWNREKGIYDPKCTYHAAPIPPMKQWPSPGPSDSERDVVESFEESGCVNRTCFDYLKRCETTISEIERLRETLEMSDGCLDMIRERLEGWGTDMSRTPGMMYPEAIESTMYRFVQPLRVALEAISGGWVEIDGGPREGMHGCLMRTIATKALKGQE